MHMDEFEFPNNAGIISPGHTIEVIIILKNVNALSSNPQLLSTKFEILASLTNMNLSEQMRNIQRFWKRVESN